jgi:hypothetical protein
MSALAAVVLAHRDPPQVGRLLAALDDVDVFVHCDRRAPAAVAREMLAGTGERVVAVPRRRTARSSWSLVAAELAGLALALERSRAEHIAVLSGSCYPLVGVEQLADELAGWRGLSRMHLNPLPYPPWSTPRNPDGGIWRLRRRFVTVRGQIVSIGGVPLRTFRRAIPARLSLHGSSQWKIYARPHAAALLRVLDEHPEIHRFWRTTLVPDELCAASILRSPELVGEAAGQVRDDCPWYLRWPSPASTGHPAWLEESDLPALREARFAPPRRPDEPVGSERRRDFRKLFTRKLSSASRPLVEAIDQELRS